MSNKSSYNRGFIIMQEHTKGFGCAADKSPAGYVKLEKKEDKMYVGCYLQNLKKDEMPYYVVLICMKKDYGKNICLGRVYTDEFSRVDKEFTALSENICNTGMNSENIVGTALVRLKDGNITSAILIGCKKEREGLPSDWNKFKLTMPEEEKNAFDQYEKNIKEQEKTTPNKYENSIKKQDEVDMEEHTNQNQTENNNLETQNMQQNMQENMQENIPIKKYGYKTEEESDEQIENNERDCKCKNSKKDKEDKEDKEYKEDKDDKKDKEDKKDDDDYKGALGDFFKNIFKGMEEVKGEITQISNCKWYKVPVKAIEDMSQLADSNKYVTVYYPMMSYYPYICRHGYYLVGVKFDKDKNIKCLIYSIKGTNKYVDQPYGGKTGFVTWVCREDLKDEEINEDTMGYWLMFYDFKNKTILIPVKE